MSVSMGPEENELTETPKTECEFLDSGKQNSSMCKNLTNIANPKIIAGTTDEVGRNTRRIGTTEMAEKRSYIYRKSKPRQPHWRR